MNHHRLVPEAILETLSSDFDSVVAPYEVGKKYDRAIKTSASSRLITATRTHDTAIQSKELRPNQNQKRQSPELPQEQDGDDSYFNLRRIKKGVLDFIYSLKF